MGNEQSFKRTKIPSYIEVEKLTIDNIGSELIVKKCLNNKSDSYRCNSLRNTLFNMLNEKYNPNDEILKNTNQSSDWRKNNYWGLCSDVKYLFGDYHGDSVKQAHKVINAFERLDKMSLQELSLINGLYVPGYSSAKNEILSETDKLAKEITENIRNKVF